MQSLDFCFESYGSNYVLRAQELDLRALDFSLSLWDFSGVSV